MPDGLYTPTADYCETIFATKSPSLLKCVFSRLFFQIFCAFSREKSLVNMEVRLGEKNNQGKEGQRTYFM